MAVPKTKHTKLVTTSDVVELGLALIGVGDLYPTRYLTERDFYPLVHAYFRGRVPAKSEWPTESGPVDFRFGGTNQALLELAVAPRWLRDGSFTDLEFPGHRKATQLHPSQNRRELKKLLMTGQGQAKKRYLLLIDFMDAHQEVNLRRGYEKEAGGQAGVRPVRIVYVSRVKQFSFPVRAGRSP